MSRNSNSERNAFDRFLDHWMGPGAAKASRVDGAREVASVIRAAKGSNLEYVCSQLARERAEQLFRYMKIADLWHFTGDDIWAIVQRRSFSDALKAVTTDRRTRRRAFAAAATTFIETFERLREKRLATPQAQPMMQETVASKDVFPDMKVDESIWDYIIRTDRRGGCV